VVRTAHHVTVQQGRLKTTIWRKRIACWIPKATNTHSEYVIIIALPLQHWLHEGASISRYAYIAYLVVIYCYPSPCLQLCTYFCIPFTTLSFFCRLNEWHSTYNLLLLLSRRQPTRDTGQTVALVLFISEQFSCSLSFTIPTLSIPLIHIHSPAVRETVSDPTRDRKSYTHSISPYLTH
jgi:hypothetical protein